MKNDRIKEDMKFVEREFIRMGFDKDARWRISDVNRNFELCNTYPRFLIIPSSFKDEDLESVAKFRYFRRVPTAVWRHLRNGCFIVRSSQPTVGWFGWFRNELDENLVQSYVNNTMPPSSESTVAINKRESVDNNIICKNDLSDHQQQPVLEANNDCDKDDLNHRTTPTNTHLHLENNSFPDQSERKDSTNDEKQTDSLNSHNNNHSGTRLVTENACEELTKSSDCPVADDSSNIKKSSDDKSHNSTSLTMTNGNGATTTLSGNTTPVNLEKEDASTMTSKMLIIDARSYTAAMANRAKGGGCECSEYYQRCEIQFMNLANIHSIRKSYQAIRGVCESYSEQSNK